MDETIPTALDGERVDRVVAVLTGLARAEVAALVSSGGVRLAGRPVRARSQRVVAGERLQVEVARRAGPEPLLADPTIEVLVVHADDDMIVVDKPAGLVVHPGAGHRTGTLVQGLLARYPELERVGQPGRPGIVHRLDMGTSGLMVVARTPAAYADLVAKLAVRGVERTYLALASGHFGTAAGLIDAPVGRAAADPTRMAISGRGRPARTRYEVVRAFREPTEATLLRCRLETGRTHQIRVHLSAIGHPVVGDARYRGASFPVALRRPFLHASHLAFEHPATGCRCSFSSALPTELEAVLARLR